MFRDRMFRGERVFHNMRRESAFQKGDLKYVLLNLLKDRPRHGYDIIRELEEQSYGLYKPSPGVIYPTLQMLEEMGYASAEETEGEKVYRITEEGREFLSRKKDISEWVEGRVKRRWSFKNVGRMALIMKEYHMLEHILSEGFRALDEDKAERIRQVLANAHQDISKILED